MTSIASVDAIQPLLDPAAYPHHCGRVTLIETHISLVLLAGDFAYKIKKEVSLGFLDYSTLTLRKRMCEEEVRLNRRLCADVYLGVVPITRDGQRLRIGGPGEVVEFAVKMRRVPPDQMLSDLIVHDAVTRDDMHAVARTLAEFHLTAVTDAAISAHGRPEGIRKNWDENFEQTRACVGHTLSKDRFACIENYVNDFLRKRRALIDERADTGRVRDVHGDLRADSVVIDPAGGVCIMDCIEFNDRIRCGDVAGDVAFLAMDLEFRGRRDLVDEFLAAYLTSADDETLPLVLDFYRCYRAYVRGKVEWLARASAHDRETRDAADARGARYFELAEAYATAPHPAVLVAMTGLSGTGKSFVAGALAARLGAALLTSDKLRRRVLELPPASEMRAAPDAGAYGPAERARVYAAMRAAADQHLQRGIPVVLDATHARRADRDEARTLVRARGLPCLTVEVVASDETVRTRLAARAETRSASDADWRIYGEQKRRFEPLDEVPEAERLRVDGAAPLTPQLDAIARRLGVEWRDTTPNPDPVVPTRPRLS